MGEQENIDIGRCVRSARERLGWSREALAYRAGLSWSAIEQIESGRRKDIRLSTLVALARALGVGIDGLIEGGRPAGSRPFTHRALMYRTDEEFLAGTLSFLAAGVERSEATIAVTSRGNINLLQDGLTAKADQVQFIEASDFYGKPGPTLAAYRSILDDKVAAGYPWVRVVGEPVWEGRSATEIRDWGLYESVVNLAFRSSPATIVCPYNAAALEPAVVGLARSTHPEIETEQAVGASPDYREPETLLFDPHPFD